MATITLTEDNFQAEVLEANTPVLVDFWAEWCGPCKAMAGDLETLSEEFAGKVKVAKVNADDYPVLATQYNVRALPTLVLFKNGEPVDIRNGLQMRSAMTKWLSEH